MRPRVARRWNHPIARLACSYGVSSLSRAFRSAGFSVTPDAIYKWIAGRRTPRIDHAAELERISRGTRTPITVGEIYGHAAEIRTQSELFHTADRTPLG